MAEGIDYIEYIKDTFYSHYGKGEINHNILQTDSQQ